MNAKPKPCMHQDLKVTTIIVRNMDIELLNADPKLCGHQTSQQMETFIIGTTILGEAITTVKSMDTSLRIALEHTSKVTIVDV